MGNGHSVPRSCWRTRIIRVVVLLPTRKSDIRKKTRGKVSGENEITITGRNRFARAHTRFFITGAGVCLILSCRVRSSAKFKRARAKRNRQSMRHPRDVTSAPAGNRRVSFAAGPADPLSRAASRRTRTSQCTTTSTTPIGRAHMFIASRLCTLCFYYSTWYLFVSYITFSRSSSSLTRTRTLARNSAVLSIPVPRACFFLFSSSFSRWLINPFLLVVHFFFFFFPVYIQCT